MSKILVRVRGNLNIVDTLNPDGPVVTLSVETFEQLAAAYGYSKADPDKISISRKTATLLSEFKDTAWPDRCYDGGVDAFVELEAALNSTP